MKIAITSQDRSDLNTAIEPRFGRARWIVVYDTESNEFSAVDNQQNVDAAQGAGVRAARDVAELGVQAVITGQVGPKAFTTLQAVGVSVFTGATGTVADAINQFKAGQLIRKESPG
ncbi:NifB/NifX family molybdenum-iron cluster-binding protein [Teredinibacter haidensis]|uniref:NifB/NifX family molybdenum-iron cluster-binding protein n=1 Tax=Teredinibacter haidensis TaxID=2731755 RepID=UPI00094913C6|nr:NifB/NifX family molybdenum-iron cluster-binding protein [Teredinibacter haidensis]